MRIDQFISGEAVDRLGDVLLLVGLDGSILDANRAALDCYGYSRADMLGLSIHDIRAPQDWEIAHDQMREAAEHGVLFEAVDRRSDGTLFPVEVKSASVSADGETALLSIVRDVTERKQAERELRESESRYRALAEGSPLAVFVNRNDPDNDDVILVNPACVRLFGASSAEDLIGKSALDLFDPDSRPLIRERIREAGGAAPFTELRVVRLDGTLVEVEAVASPLLDQGLSAIQVVLRDITERNRSELELQATALYSRSLIEASLDPLVTIDHDGVIADVNKATEEATGVPREILIGTDFTSYFTDPDRARVGYETVLKEGVIRNYPLSLKRSSGDVIDVEYNATIYCDEAGEVQGVFASARDVTQSKNAHAQMARLAAIITSSEDAIFSEDRNEIIASWNAGAEALYGYSAAEMIGASVDSLMPPGRENEARQLTERVLQGDRISGFETQRRRKDSSLVDVSETLSPIPDDAGDIVAVSVIQRDITERKRNEREVRQSAEKFAIAFNASPDLLSITRLSDDMILEVNEGYERLLGHTRAESVGKTTTALSIWADSDNRAEFITTLEKDSEIADFGTTLLRKDGAPIAVIISARTFELQGEMCVLSVVHDITERKQAEAELAQQKDRVERALSSVIDIASSIVEAGDPYTAGHQRRVSELAARIAQDMGMSDQDVDDIRVAGLLHDVGKVTVPTQILTKPGVLSPSEFSVIRDHSLAGYRIITSAHMTEPIPELVYQHHERCDGSGYPRRLLADQILKGAKVLAVADTVEAMMSHRPYRPALGIEMALAEIERGAGTLYDAEVSRACLALFREGDFVLSP